MVVEYIRYEVKPARHAAFIAAYESAAKELAKSEHCLRYEISEGVEEPNNFTVRIEWDSVEGHEHGFRTSPGFRPFFADVKPFFDDIREMKHYKVLRGGGGGGRG
jgi:quinol monooxygenase YgiN